MTIRPPKVNTIQPAKSIRCETDQPINENADDTSDDNEDDNKFYWKKDITNELINIYETHAHKFSSPRYRKIKIWDIIRTELICFLKRTGSKQAPSITQVQNKWKSLMRGFKNPKNIIKFPEITEVTCDYYNRLDEICGDNPNITPLCTSSSSGLGDTQREQKNKLDRDLQEDEAAAGPSKKTSSGIYTEK